MSESPTSSLDDVEPSAPPTAEAASDAGPAAEPRQGGPVEAAVRALVADAASRPVEEHPDLFEQAHQRLRDALAAAAGS